MHLSGLRSVLAAGAVAWGLLAITASGATAQEAKPSEQPAAVGQPEANTSVQDKNLRERQLQEVRQIVAQRAAREKLERQVQYLVRLTAVIATESLIGIETAPVDDVLRSHLDLSADKGVLVTAVTENGPAAQAGIAKNDVLISVRDQEIAGPAGLDALLKDNVRKATPIAAIRMGRRLSVTVTPLAVQKIGIADEKLAARAAAAQPGFWLGVGLSPADDTLRSHLGLEANTGLVVTSVENNSPAAKAGILVNDVLLKFDGRANATVESLAAHVQEIAEKSVPLDLLRHGKPAMLTVTPERRPDVRFTALIHDWDQLAAARLSANFALTRIPVESYYSGMATPANVHSLPVVQRQIAELLEQVQRLQKKLVELEASLKAPVAEQAPAGGK